MSIAESTTETEYPESDGKPMGETDLDRDWMIRILDILKYRYRNQRVYVASDLLLYYEKGDKRRFVVPDEFVVLDSDPGRRRTYLLWEEGKSPDVVFEVTSRGTRRKDLGKKWRIYERIGVKEYFLHDPSGVEMEPPLQGFRLRDEAFDRIASEDRKLRCEVLGIVLQLDDDDLLMTDVQSGQPLLTSEESEFLARESERQDAEARIRELEAEVERLRRVRGDEFS